MKKKILFLFLGLAAIVSTPFAYIAIRDAHYPIPIKPSESWEPYVNSLDAQHEAFFVETDDDTQLEAELFIPNGGTNQKPAIVFSPGSGDGLYQNYSPGFIETFILEAFLENDFAILLVNKRGMGQSEGNYTKNSIAGRAADVYAALQSIKTHPQIDPENIGLVGHSQGGWVVTQTAADHPDITFFISLAGPTITMLENSSDNTHHYGVCQGMEGEDLEEYIEKRLKMVRISISIGEKTNFGMFGFDARNMEYDPRTALQTTQVPGLFIFAENDALVSPSLNIDRMNEIFNHSVPKHINMVVIDDATHSFRLVDNTCDSFENPEEFKQSTQLTEVVSTWLTELGY